MFVLLSGLFLFPTLSFAGAYVTIDQFNALQTRVLNLESEVASLQSIKVGSTSPTTLAVALLSQSTDFSPSHALYPAGYSAPSGTYNLSFSITPSQDVYLPISAGSTASNGVDYFVTGPGNSSGFLQCNSGTSTVTSGGVSYCLVRKGVTGNFSVFGTVTGISSNSSSVGVSAINFKTSITDTTYYSYLPSGLVTKGIQ